MNKWSLFKQVVEALRAEREKAEQARDAAQEEANQHVGRMESRYDTFREEAQYAVAAQEKRILEYEKRIQQVEELLTDPAWLGPGGPAVVGSVVILRPEKGDEKRLFIAPAGGGIVIQDESGPVTVLTPDAPLGSKLLGLAVGDSFELNGTCFSVTAIS